MAKIPNVKNAAVLPSMADYGLASKEQRGIVGGLAERPQVLNPIQATLSRFAKRIGADLSGSVRDISENVKRSLAQAAPVPAMQVAADKGSDYTL